jgi:flagellin
MRELAVQSSNDTNVELDRSAIQNEIVQLRDEIDRIGNTTEFNTMKLIDGNLSGSQIGGKGSQIGTATSAEISIDNIDPAGWADGGSTKYMVKIDGQAFTLTGLVDTDAFTFFESLETTLTAAIDTFNSTATDADKIEVPTFTITAAAINDMTFTITSNATGTKSELEIIALHEDETTIDTGSLDGLLGIAGNVKGSDGLLDADIDITAQSFEFSVNGNKINVDLSENTYEADSEMTEIAADIQTQMNQALSDYKDLTGKDFGEVTVTVKDGVFVVNSSKPDTVTLEFGVNETTTLLGLAGSSTSESGGVTFQIGANKGQNINLQIGDMRSSALEIADVDLSTRESADNAIQVLDNALNKVSAERSKLGSVQNRLEHSIKNLDTSSENLQASESRIRDVDMAKEMMEFTKNNILQQAAQAMLAQANQAPQGVLQLLR